MTGRELNSGIARTFSLRGEIYELYEYCSIKQGDFFGFLLDEQIMRRFEVMGIRDIYFCCYGNGR